MVKLVVVLFWMQSTVFFTANAQERFGLGIQGGRSVVIGETLPTSMPLMGFNAKGNGGANISVYLRYRLSENLGALAGGGINSLIPSGRFMNADTGGKLPGKQPHFFAGIDYDLQISNSRFGFLPKLVLGFTGNPQERKHRNFISEKGEIFQLHGVSVPNSSVINIHYLYLHSLQTHGSKNNIIFHVRPEIALYKNVGKHRILISGMYGYALGDDYYVRNYKELSYREERYNSVHRFKGSYYALILGFEFGF